MDGKFSVGYRDAVVRTVVGLDRETTAAYTLVLEAIGKDCPTVLIPSRVHTGEPGLEPNLCPVAMKKGPPHSQGTMG